MTIFELKQCGASIFFDTVRLSRRRWSAAKILLAVFLWVVPNAAIAQIVAPAAPCNSIAGTIATCSGDLHQGVLAISPTFQSLNVTTSTDITPLAGIDGVRFVDVTNGNNLSIKVNTTGAPLGIVTTDGASGISLTSDLPLTNYGDGSISSTANIDAKGTSGIGINANRTAFSSNAASPASATSGILTVASHGNIQTELNGTGIISHNEAFANSGTAAATAVTGDVTVTSTVNIFSGDALGNTGGIGIRASSISLASGSGNGDAVSKTGAVSVTSTGNISVGNGGWGIWTTVAAGAVSQNGAASAASGDTLVRNAGTITAGFGGFGITTENNTSGGTNSHVASLSPGDTTIVNTGSVAAGSNGFGIRAFNFSSGALGKTTITNSGTVSAGDNGIGIFIVQLNSGSPPSGDATINIELAPVV